MRPTKFRLASQDGSCALELHDVHNPSEFGLVTLRVKEFESFAGVNLDLEDMQALRNELNRRIATQLGETVPPVLPGQTRTDPDDLTLKE